MGDKLGRLKTLGMLAGLSAGAMYVINRSVSISSITKNILRPEKGSYYHWKLGDVYYEVHGNENAEEVLLLLHDATPYSSGYEWREVISSLSNSRLVYIMDLPGCGRSEKPAVTYVNYMYVQLLTSFIQDVIGRPAHVIASGMTSSFVATAAFQTQDLFSKITMINPPGLMKLRTVPEWKTKLLRILLSLPVIGTTVYHVVTRKRSVEKYLKKKCYANTFLLNNLTVDAYYEASHRDYGKGKYFLGSLQGGYLNWSIDRFLPKLTIPVTCLYGESEPGERSVVNAYKKLNPHFQVAGIPDSKKLPQLENPKQFLERIS